MVTQAKFREWALNLPEAAEAPHFDKTSFRIRKKIFATMNGEENRVCLKFTPEDQSVFSRMAAGVVRPVPNKWGKQGWTLIDLADIDPELCEDALRVAYCSVAPSDLSALLDQD